MAHGLLILVTLVWGTTFALVKLALRDSTPLAFNLVRMTLASAVLAVVNYRSLGGINRRDMRAGAAAGFFLGLGYQLQTSGLAHTTASVSAFLTGLVVVFVPLFSAIPGVLPTGQRKPGWPAFAGAAIAFLGLVLLTTPPGSGMALLSGIHLGEALTLACAAAFALHLLTLSRTASQVSAQRLGTLQIGFCALTMVLTLPLGGHAHIALTPTVLVALAVTALLATAAAFTIQSWAQQHLSATHTALILTLEPVFAWLFSMLFLGEHLSHRTIAGATLILAGILVSELVAATSTPNGGILPTAER